MRLLIFCDESTLSFINYSTIGNERKFVFAYDRPEAVALAQLLDVEYIVQWPIGSSDYHTFVSKVVNFKANYLFCSSYSIRIPEVILNSVTNGAINFHGGILPQWRGANILNWVLIYGSDTTGVTAHWMTSEIDKGPVIAVNTVPISITDTAVTLRAKLSVCFEKMFLNILESIKGGQSLPRLEQRENLAKVYRRRSPQDGRIDWMKSDLEIYNLIRALVNPWPGAYTVLRDGKMIVFNEFVPLNEIVQLRSRFEDGY
jgi:methionyl-tRNA formyltransferase